MRWIWKKKWIMLAILLFLSALAGEILWSANAFIGRYNRHVYRKLEDVPAKRVALLLGTSKTVYGKPNLFYENRLEAVVRLYQSGKIKKILVSGDNRKMSYNEPALMRKDLVQRGIPLRDIYLDFAGFRTLDSIVRAREVFGLDDFIVVSQQFHCERAIYIASRRGIKAIGFAADDVNSPGAQRVYIREYVARLAALIDQELLHTRPKFGGPAITIE